MATNPRTNPGSRVPTDPLRRTALVAGILYLATFLSSIPAVFLQGPVFDDPNFILGGGGPTPWCASARSSTSSTA